MLQKIAALIYSVLDLTSLNDSDTPQTITELCKNSVLNDLQVAAVCVYPRFITHAKKHLPSQKIRLATVANFPSGNQPIAECAKQIEHSIQAGANEIDMVLPYHAFLQNDVKYVNHYLTACRDACGNKTLKVILETGELKTHDNILLASQIAIRCGADFLKTSTGKVKEGATLSGVTTMIEAVKSQERKVGIKVSGGVRTLIQATNYLNLIVNELGEEYQSAKYFRIGASGLVNELSDVLKKYSKQ